MIYFNFDKNVWVLQQLDSERSDRNAAIFETYIITVSHTGGCDTPALISTLKKQVYYWGADKSLARPGRKQATATKL